MQRWKSTVDFSARFDILSMSSIACGAHELQIVIERPEIFRAATRSTVALDMRTRNTVVHVLPSDCMRRHRLTPTLPDNPHLIPEIVLRLLIVASIAVSPIRLRLRAVVRRGGVRRAKPPGLPCVRAGRASDRCNAAWGDRLHIVMTDGQGWKHVISARLIETLTKTASQFIQGQRYVHAAQQLTR